MSSHYHLVWLDSCLQETLLPGSPWTKIKDVINARLATKVETFCKHSQTERIQSLLHLLGRQFVETYLGSVTLYNQVIQDKPDLSDSYKEEAEAWLKTALNEITRSLGLQWRESSDAVSRDILEFVGFAQQTVYRGMERELAATEPKIAHDHQKGLSNKRQPSLLGCSHQSETLGKAVAALLKKHPSQLGHICEQLQGRPLTNSLRHLIWSTRLLRINLDGEKSHKDLETVMEELRSQFEVTLSWGLKELGVSNAVHSPIAGVIEHAVSEAYKYRHGLHSELVTDMQRRLAVEGLNVLYVYNRSYEPQYAVLVYPLIVGALNEYDNARNSYPQDVAHKLAIALHLLLKNCFPTRLQIFSMADHVMQRLQQEDEELYNHLTSETLKNVPSNPREFLVNFIHTEKEKAMLAERQAVRSSFESLPSDAKELLFHPVMFIRKWMGEGFVGILGVHAVMLVWDQFFLSNWKHNVMENTCLVILQLLRTHILEAEGYMGIGRILLDQPSELFTVDVQKGLSYLDNGGALIDVGSLRQPTPVPSPSEHSEIVPSPVPSASESPQTSLSRPISRRSTPSTPVQADPVELWVETKATSSPIEESTNYDSFDVYIDEVRFLPDNATVIKVTGRILGPFWKTPETLEVSDIEAFPMLDSSARCPKFHYKYTVSAPESGIPEEVMMLLRIYTLDVNSGELIVIGNSIIRIFTEKGDDEWRLKAGGHQLPLKHILPSTVAKLTEESFDDITKVPVCSVLIRLLPHSEEFIESPGYASGFYVSDQCKPNESELRIFQRFQSHHAYPPTVREAVRDVKEGETNHDAEEFDFTSDQVVTQWYQRRTSKHILMREPAKPMDLIKVVQYDQNQGLSIMVEQAFGLPNTHFVNALLHVSPGRDVQGKEATEEGYGGEEKALVKQRDFNSYQKSPKWIDPFMVFHPHWDDMTVLLIRLYSLDASYTPRTDGAGPGSVADRKGKTLTLVPAGWTVLKLFTREYVNAGVHYLPLFEGTLSTTFLEFLSNHPVETSLQEAIKQHIHTLLGTSCVAIRLWDAHYSPDECIPLPVKEELLSLGRRDRYKKTIQTTSGKLISDVILQTLTRQERKQGVVGSQYIAEKEHYEEAMNGAFNDLLVDVLLQNGLGPLT